MKFSVTAEGINVVKDLTTRLIPFEEIRRIEIDQEKESFFITKDHEDFTDKKLGDILNHPHVYNAISQYNIAFIDHFLKDFHEKTYTEEELAPLLEKTKKIAQECADQCIKEQFGEEYSVHVYLDKDYEHYHLYFMLLRNDLPVDLPKDMRMDGGLHPKAFGSMTVTDLLEWKTSSHSGVYGIVEEVADPEECHSYVETWIKDYFDFFKRKEKEHASLQKALAKDAAKPKPIPKDHLFRRYTIFILGLFIASMGVAFSTVAELGTSPVASVPYSVFLADGGTTLSFGGWLNLLSLIQIGVQILVLRSACDWLEILIQTILAFVYGYLTNFSCWLLRDISLTRYEAQLVFMLLGCVILALGIWVQLKGGVAMLPGEAMNRAISQVTKKRYENVKIFFDVFYISLSALICLIFLGELRGVREGSIVAAILVGTLIKLYNFIFSKVLKLSEPPKSE